MRMRVKTTAVGLLAVFLVTGCTAVRQDERCKWALPLTSAALGTLAGGLISAYAVNHGDSGGSKNWEIAAGTGAGLLAGSLVGLLAGHLLCEEAEPPPPPPPPPPAPPARGTKIAHLPGANFAFGSAKLTAEGRANVSKAAAVLKQHPTVRVDVDGHTDSIGSEAYNQGLSERRAQSVADALVEDGIARNRLIVRGFGKSKPIASNSTEAGRAENRRVEIIVD